MMVSLNRDRKMETQKDIKIILPVVLIVAIVDIVVPYLFLKDVTKFWANYLFWFLLTGAIIIFGILYVSKWGEE